MTHTQKHLAAAILVKQAAGNYAITGSGMPAYMPYTPPPAPAPYTPRPAVDAASAAGNKKYWQDQIAAHRAAATQSNLTTPLIDRDMFGVAKTVFPISRLVAPDNFTLNNARETYNESVGPAFEAVGGLFGHPIKRLGENLWPGLNNASGITPDGRSSSGYAGMLGRFLTELGDKHRNTGRNIVDTARAVVPPLYETTMAGASTLGRGAWNAGAPVMAAAGRGAASMLGNLAYRSNPGAVLASNAFQKLRSAAPAAAPVMTRSMRGTGALSAQAPPPPPAPPVLARR